MTGRKRPPERGPSPPTNPHQKRPRESEWSASRQEEQPTTERATHAPNRPLPPPGPHAGLPDHAQTGPSNNGIANDRENPSSRPQLNTNTVDRRPSNTATRVQDRPDSARRGSQAFSPAHVQSPGGDSGGSTPVQNALPVPSMMPKSTLNNKPSQPATDARLKIEAMRQMRRKKQASINAMIARNGDTSYDETILEQVESLKSENSQLLSRVNTLENQVKQLIDRFDQSPKDFEAVNEPKAASYSTKSEISEAIKSFVLEAVGAKDDGFKGILREELNNMDVSIRLYVDETAENTKKAMEKKIDNTDKKAEKDHKAVVTLTTGFNAIDKQVRDLIKFIGPIHEYYMLKRTTLLDRITQHANQIGQVQRCQSEHEKLSKEQTRIHDCLDELFTKDKAKTVKMAAINDGLAANIESLSNKLTNLTVSFGAEQAAKNQSLSAQSQTLKEIKAAMNAATITQQLAQVKADVITLQSSVANTQALSPLVDSLRSRLGDLEKDSENLTALESQVAKLSDTIIAVKDRPVQATDTNLIAKVVEEHLQANAQLLSSRLEADTLGASTHPSQRNSDDGAQKTQPDAKALGISMQELEDKVEDRLEPVQMTVHQLSNDLAALQHDLPGLLRQALDSFKLSVGQDIQQLRADMTTFQQQTLSAPSFTQLDSILEDTKGLKTELENFQRSRTNESSLRERETLELKKELALKADFVTLDGMLNNLRCSLRSLQDQYNNISTETLHQKMVHWFLKNYPSNQANLVLQVKAMQHEVQEFQDLAGQLAWLPSKSQDLNALLTYAPQLQTLAYSADSLHRLVQQRSRIDQACEEAQEAVKIVRTVEKTLNEKTEFLQSAIRTDIDEIQKSRAETDTRVNALESASPALRQDIDRIRTDFVEPNKEALAMYGQLVLTLGQVQETVRAICQNLPTVNGRNPAQDIAFSYDLSAKPTESKKDGTNSSSRG